jgi:hypothetical protein
MFIEYLHEGVTFLLDLNNLFLGEKKVFWFACKTIIIFLIISSNIHIRIFENVFLTIKTRLGLQFVSPLWKRLALW